MPFTLVLIILYLQNKFVGIRAIYRTAVLPSKHCLLILDTSVAELANYQFYTAVDINKEKLNHGTHETNPRTKEPRRKRTQKSSLQAGKHLHIIGTF